MTELNDQSLLIHWYRHRNAEAFRVLASRHGRMVYATALRILRNPHDAEDVSQQSFLALAQTRRPPSGNVAAWLHRTTFREALNLTRARNRRTARDHAYATAQPDSTRTEWDDIRDLVDEAVAGLPDACRDCIVLYFFEEQTHAAIGERLGITRQAVAQRIEKGIALVRKRLASKGVIAPAGALLVALIHENTAQALPATLATELGRIALAGTPSVWATVATYTTGAAFNVAAAMLVVGVGVAVSMAGSGPGAASNPAEVRSASESQNLRSISESGTVIIPVAASVDLTQSASLAAADGAVESEGAPGVQPALASAAGAVTLANGRPFPNATVKLMNVSVMDSGRYPEGTFFELKTDARGRFEQTGMPSAEYSVMVTEPEDNTWSKANEFMRITLAPGERRDDVNIVFGTEGDLTISGTVVDDGEGRPLEGVRVYKFGPVPRAAMTDAQGRFTLRYLPDDDIEFHLDKSGYSGRGTTAPAGTQDVRLTMYGNGAIAGRAIDAQTRKPLPHFEVSYMNGHWSAFQESLFGNGKQCDDSDGTFELTQVYVGEVTVAARAPGYGPTMAQVTVEPGQTLRDVSLELSRADATVLSGSVVTEDGTPIAGANIYTEMSEPTFEPGQNVLAVTDSSGAFTVENALPDTPFFIAWHPDYAPGSSSVTEKTTIVLKHAARLNVEVLSGGQPMPHIQVLTYFLNALNVRSLGGGVTGTDGRALVAEIIPGQVVAEILLPASRTQHKVLNFAPGDEKSVQFEVSPGESSVEGTVYNDGEPVTGGRVSLYVESETGLELFKKDIAADGTFEIRDVPSGTAQLVVIGADYIQRTRVDGVMIVPGETTTLTVDTTPTRKVSGEVGSLHASDAALVTIFCGAMDTEEAISAAIQSWFGPDLLGVGTTDGTKPYELPLHAPGTYTLLLSTYRANNAVDVKYHESRVVEVGADEDLVANFSLNY